MSDFTVKALEADRVVVLVEWATAYLTFQRSARLITNDRADRL